MKTIIKKFVSDNFICQMKSLHSIMQLTANQMIKYLLEKIKTSEHIEMREACANYATNVVVSSVFGIDGDAFENDNSEIRHISKNVLKPSFRLIFVLFISPFIPRLTKFLKIKLCREKEEQLLKQLFDTAAEHRKRSNISSHPDFLEYLIQLREKKKLSDIEMTAHALSFFLDGVETSSITLSNIFYELAKNPRCQEKLREEMIKIKNKKGFFDFDSLKNNKYLDQVIYGK